MKFAEPLWLLAGLIACGALVWAWRRYDARQRAALATFASSHLHAQLTASFSAARRNWKRGLFLAADRLPLRRARAAAGRFPLGGSEAARHRSHLCRGHLAQHVDARREARPPHPRQARRGRFREPPGRRRRRPDRLRGQRLSAMPHHARLRRVPRIARRRSTPPSFRAAARTSPAPFARRRPRCKTARAQTKSSSCSPTARTSKATRSTRPKPRRRTA